MSEKNSLSQNEEENSYPEVTDCVWPLPSLDRSDKDKHLPRKRTKRVFCSDQNLVFEIDVIGCVRKKLFKNDYYDKDSTIGNASCASTDFEQCAVVPRIPLTTLRTYEISHQEVKNSIGVRNGCNGTLERDVRSKIAATETNDVQICTANQLPFNYETNEEIFHQEPMNNLQSGENKNLNNNGIGMTNDCWDALEKDINATKASMLSNDVAIWPSNIISSSSKANDEIPQGWLMNGLREMESSISVTHDCTDVLDMDISPTNASTASNVVTTCTVNKISVNCKTDNENSQKELVNSWKSLEERNLNESSISVTHDCTDVLDMDISPTNASTASNVVTTCTVNKIPVNCKTDDENSHKELVNSLQSIEQRNRNKRTITVKEMKQSIVDCFRGITNEDCFHQAISFITMIPFQYPPTEMLNFILYKIILESEEKHTAFKALEYVSELLSFYPPCNSSFRKYYHRALFRRDGHLKNMWDSISNLIECCFRKCGIPFGTVYYEQEKVRKPCNLNCLFLLKFVVDVVNDDFRIYTTKRSISPVKNFSMNKSLICRLFWPFGKIGVMNSNTKNFIRFIKCLLRQNNEGLKLELLQLLQKILCLMVECARFEAQCSEIEALHCRQLEEILQEIFLLLEDTIQNVDKLKFFLMGMPIRWLRMKFCECVIIRTIYKTWPGFHVNKPLMLRKIVQQYMFPVYNEPHQVREDCNIIKEQKFLEDEAINALHKSCSKDEPGTLAKLLSRNPGINVNAKDKHGLTPLHKTCSRNSFQCAKILFLFPKLAKDSPYVPVDLHATSNTGNTPLHSAVESNNIDLAQLFLENGGSEILDIRNSFGLSPRDMALRGNYRKLTDLFKEYPPSNERSTASNSSKYLCTCDLGMSHFTDGTICAGDVLTKRGPPMCGHFEYYMYLHSLHLLISDYFNVFHLPELHRKCDEPCRIDLDDLVRKHFVEKCKYQPKSLEIIAKCDDLLVMKNLPHIIRMFSDCLTNNAKTFDLDIAHELLCIKILTFTCR